MNIHRYKNDWLFVLSLIVFLTSIYGTMVYINKSSIKVRQLNIELRALRNAVAVFYEVNERVPETLDELAKSVYYKNKKKAEYLPIDLKNKVLSGKILDPFNEPYVYDGETGKIQTKSESRLDREFK